MSNRKYALRISIAALACGSVLSACSAEPGAIVGSGAKRRAPTSSDAGAQTSTNGSGNGDGNGGSGASDDDAQPPGTTTTPPSTTPTPDAGANVPDAAAPGVDATNGAGGPTGFNELTSTRGLKYQIDAPATPGPRGILILLHGSGASNYANFIKTMAPVATQYDLIRVSVLAPNGQGWNEGDQNAAAGLLHDLIQTDLYPKYNIDKSKVLLSGQSSGGGFLATHFVPLHAKDYRGGAFMQCGAEQPRVTFAPDATTRANFRLHFEITTGDTIWPDAYVRAVNAYTQAGMQLTKDNTKPGGHCAFKQENVILDHMKFILGQ